MGMSNISSEVSACFDQRSWAIFLCETVKCGLWLSGCGGKKRDLEALYSSALLSSTLIFSALLYSYLLYSSPLCFTHLYSILLFFTRPFSTLLFSTLPWMSVTMEPGARNGTHFLVKTIVPMGFRSYTSSLQHRMMYNRDVGRLSATDT